MDLLSSLCQYSELHIGNHEVIQWIVWDEATIDSALDADMNSTIPASPS